MNEMSDGISVFNDGDAFAAYRLPHGKEHYLLSAPAVVLGSLDAVPDHSFVVSSFEHSTQHVSYIPATRQVLNGRFAFNPTKLCGTQATTKERYLEQAKELIADVRSGRLEKIVLSRIKLLPRGEEDLYDIFERLKERYPSAFVFLYNFPGRGCWCGATPETLIRMEKDQLVTMALAGTQRDNGLALDTVEWTDKEVHEQGVIEDFIELELERLGLSFVKNGPYTVRAGEVLHIRSDFMVNGPLHLSQMVGALHPGPAICGRPREEVKDRILKIEDHKREDYCGFLGPLGVDGKTELYVNLRSMQVFSNHLALYLGGGLTARSLPPLEWDETELKAATIMGAIDKVLS